MKKVLIHIGASELQKDSLRWAKEAGLYVVATDKNQSADCRYLADEFFCISGTDVQSLVELALKINKSNEVIGAYCSNDFGLMAVAAINSELELKGCLRESVELSLDKSCAKEIFKNMGIPVPRGIVINKHEHDFGRCDKLKWPLIVKPVDSCGSQGVESVNDFYLLSNAIANARQYSEQVLIEEFFNGDGIDTIGVMKDGVFYPCGIEKRVFSELPYQFPIYGYTPPCISNKDIERAYKITETASLALGIKHGPVKADLLYKGGEFVLLELTPRFHGDVFTSMLIPEAHGTSPILDLFLDMASQGSGVEYNYNKINSEIIAWRAFLPKKNAINYNDISDRIKLRWNLKKIFVDKRDKVEVINHIDNAGVAGFVFISFESEAQLEEFIEWFKREFEFEFV